MRLRQEDGESETSLGIARPCFKKNKTWARNIAQVVQYLPWVQSPVPQKHKKQKPTPKVLRIHMTKIKKTCFGKHGILRLE
jgi:hypothetical protein